MFQFKNDTRFIQTSMSFFDDDDLVGYIIERNLIAFKTEWLKVKDYIPVKDKQKLLVEMVMADFKENDFEFYRYAFDLIIENKIKTNFKLYSNSILPDLLEFSLQIPSKRLFDYFYLKGAMYYISVKSEDVISYIKTFNAKGFEDFTLNELRRLNQISNY